MTFTRRLQIALFFPIYLFFFGVFFVACALDRLLRLPHPFPRDPRGLARRRDWCIETLIAAGALPRDARVTGFEVLSFKATEAFRSSLARVIVDYDVGGATVRFEAVAKFAPAGGSIANRVIFVFQRVHLNEVGFYAQLAAGSKGTVAPASIGLDSQGTKRPASSGRLRGVVHHASVPALGSMSVPRAYYARAAPVTGNFCILLECVPDVIEHTEEAGCPLDAAREALATLAAFHARHWGRASSFPAPVSAFTIDFACSFAWGRRNRVLRHLARTSWHQGNTPQTLIHGDARVGNMLFSTRPSTSRGPVTLIDWQALRWGRAAFDLNYFLLLSLDSSTREAHEGELIAHYHAALYAAGVTDYSLEALREDLRHALILVGSLLIVPFLGGEITLDTQNASRAMSGTVMWILRLGRALETLDTAWLEARYGVDGPTLRATIAQTMRTPPILNRGAVMLARHFDAEARKGWPSTPG
jgi:hypothetical protein